ncbi:MAG: 3-isopropylmalate dehydratase small subunit [Spirochaetales bacterium]|uniref:3-isopropylmalate dehydratase n=1 Tax=Candidatus Thalassospirochaeta sargassi TaxID=3119039 RepID=A0AAJ1II52_9SPIO|nr:3-isopropylmalate dehydratase small subunit [Spirochaetales bacterium]
MSANDIKITNLTGQCVPVRGNDIDTDRIIPARFMKVVSFEGLGEAAFYDIRYNSNGKTDHPFNLDVYQDASILLVNKNFGCGSSREHAPQALMRWGIKAVVGESFAEIFSGNCTSLGIPVVEVDSADIGRLMNAAEETPNMNMIIDIESMTLNFGDFEIEARMNSAARNALMTGSWDSTGVLLDSGEEIDAMHESLPY